MRFHRCVQPETRVHFPSPSEDYSETEMTIRVIGSTLVSMLLNHLDTAKSSVLAVGESRVDADISIRVQPYAAPRRWEHYLRLQDGVLQELAGLTNL